MITIDPASPVPVAASHPTLSPEPAPGVMFHAGHYVAQHSAPAPCCGERLTRHDLMVEDARSGEVFHFVCLLREGWTVAPRVLARPAVMDEPFVVGSAAVIRDGRVTVVDVADESLDGAPGIEEERECASAVMGPIGDEQGRCVCCGRPLDEWELAHLVKPMTIKGYND
jgi:hypothetical protein